MFLINCFMYLPFFVEVMCFVFVSVCIRLAPFYVCLTTLRHQGISGSVLNGVLVYKFKEMLKGLVK